MFSQPSCLFKTAYLVLPPRGMRWAMCAYFDSVQDEEVNCKLELKSPKPNRVEMQFMLSIAVNLPLFYTLTSHI